MHVLDTPLACIQMLIFLITRSDQPSPKNNTPLPLNYLRRSRFDLGHLLPYRDSQRTSKPSAFIIIPLGLNEAINHPSIRLILGDLLSLSHAASWRVK